MINRILIFLFIVSVDLQGMNLNSFPYLRSSLQKYAPSFYLNWVCWGELRNNDIFYAAQKGDLPFLKAARVATNGRINLNFGDQQAQKSPLFAAVENNHPHVVEFLLDNGANVNQGDAATGRTPLHAAFLNHNLFTAGLLLHYKPDISIQDRNGRSVISSLHNGYSEEEKSAALEFVSLSLTESQKLAVLKNLSPEESLQIVRLDDNRLKAAVEKNDSGGVQKILSLDPSLVRCFDNDTLEKLPANEARVRLGKHLKKLSELKRQLTDLYPVYKKAHDAYRQRNLREINPGTQRKAGVTVTKSESMLSVLAEEPAFASNLAFYNVATLQSLVTYTKKAIEDQTGYCEKHASCCICQNEYENKNFIVICKNQHSLCLACANNPALKACPLCRQEYKFDRLKVCQTCGTSQPSVRNCFCQECQAVVAVCKKCTQLPCCRKKIDEAGLKNTENQKQVKKYFTAFKSEIWQSREKEIDSLRKKYLTDIETLGRIAKAQVQRVEENLKKIRAMAPQIIRSLDELVKKIKGQEEYIERFSMLSTNSINLTLRSMVEEHDQMVEKYNKQLDQYRDLGKQETASMEDLRKLRDDYQREVENCKNKNTKDLEEVRNKYHTTLNNLRENKKNSLIGDP